MERLGRAPLLVGFLANADPAARMYASWTGKTCLQKFVGSFIYLFIFIFYFRGVLICCSGVRFELREVDRDDLEEKIIAANMDDAVGGIIVYYPVFGSSQV